MRGTPARAGYRWCACTVQVGAAGNSRDDNDKEAAVRELRVVGDRLYLICNQLNVLLREYIV